MVQATYESIIKRIEHGQFDSESFGDKDQEIERLQGLFREIGQLDLHEVTPGRILEILNRVKTM